MNSLEKKITQAIHFETHQPLTEYTQSLQLMAFHNGRKKAHLQWGPEYKYFDLASLTKILFTVSTFMRFTDQKLISVDDKIKKTLAWWVSSSTKWRDVLSHKAGLEWWAPFYKMLNATDSHEVRRMKIRNYLENLKLGSKKKCVYSDLDFILLGFGIEKIDNSTLAESWQKTSSQWNLPTLHFCEENRSVYDKSLYAPTENCPWRKKVLQGEVHDDNTWMMGGLSTHAGLFGTLEDVSQWGLYLRKALLGKKNPLAKESTARLFTRREVRRSEGDWALGFMMPSLKGSSAGQYFSKKSIGHTGFTGTSLWYDPVKDLLVVILSNRVHPTRANEKFKQLRPFLHDVVYKNL